MSTPQMLRGIGGWLLLLCISLTIFTPLALLAALAAENDLSERTKAISPTFSTTLFIAALFRLLLVVLCVRAGVSLWRENVNAVSRAQTFLIILAGYSALRITIVFSGSLPPDLKSQLLGIYSLNAVQTTVFAVIWHQYLSRSVRVANTFRKVPNKAPEPTPTAVTPPANVRRIE